jgi:hypothetical protein
VFVSELILLDVDATDWAVYIANVGNMIFNIQQ